MIIKIKRKRGFVYRAQVGSAKLKTRKTKTFARKEDAIDWELKMKLENRDPVQRVNFAKYSSIDQIKELYISSLHESRQKHQDDVKHSIEEICRKCNIKYLKDLVPEVVEKFKRLVQIKPISINKMFKHLKGMCKFAVREGLMKSNPLIDFEYLKIARKKSWALDKHESQDLLETVKRNSPNVWFPIVYTLMNTGMRKREIVTLEFDDIKWDDNEIEIRDKPHIPVPSESDRPHTTKTEGSKRRIPMTESLRTLLEDLYQKRKGNIVFPTKNGTPRWNGFGRDFTKAIKGIKFTPPGKITPHVLRHSFVSQLFKYARLDLYTIAKLVGHENPRTTELYAHLLGGDEEIHRAIKGLPDYSDVLKGDESADEVDGAKKTVIHLVERADGQRQVS